MIFVIRNSMLTGYFSTELENSAVRQMRLA
jgi:hypothetical protein